MGGGLYPGTWEIETASGNNNQGELQTITIVINDKHGS
jgi:hypothetical protein